VIERQPRLPLGVGNAGSVLQRGSQWRQFGWNIGIFGEQRAQPSLARISAGHIADEMHHGVAIGDIDSELIYRFITEVLEILIYLHLDIVPRQIAAQQIAIAAEFVRDSEREICTDINARPLSGSDIISQSRLTRKPRF
jgi:hypothetical protein